MIIKFNIVNGVLAFTFALLLFACDEPQIMEQVDLNGKWNLLEAKRNRKATETLKGTFFKFSKDLMTNNITEAEKMVPFTLDGNRIVTQGDVSYSYYIQKHRGDTILLTSNIQSNKFEFLLLKEKQDGK